MDGKGIREGLAALGECLRVPRDVEILIVGGAAGVLTGELPGAWTTGDVDVIHFHPAADRDDVLAAAGEAAHRLNLPPSWMSEDAGLYRWSLPPDWRARRRWVDRYGRLIAFAAGRFDLIAMKFAACRSRDLEHLIQMRVTCRERDDVRAFLDAVEHDWPAEAGKIANVRLYVDNWECAP